MDHVTPRTVVVAHREAMVAEGIASGLARYPWIAPIGVETSSAGAERRGDSVDAVALDARLPGAEPAAHRLRRKGVRVVLIGEARGADEDVRVPTTMSIAALAAALVPGAEPTLPSPARLTPRERQVLALVARGFVGKQVARQLGISAKTVERHKTRMYSKLGVANQAAAVSAGLAGGLAAEVPWSRSTT